MMLRRFGLGPAFPVLPSPSLVSLKPNSSCRLNEPPRLANFRPALKSEVVPPLLLTCERFRVFLAAGFGAALAFGAGAFFAGTFFATAFLTTFFATAFFATGFFATAFLTTFLTTFFATAFFFTGAARAMATTSVARAVETARVAAAGPAALSWRAPQLATSRRKSVPIGVMTAN